MCRRHRHLPPKPQSYKSSRRNLATQPSIHHSSCTLNPAYHSRNSCKNTTLSLLLSLEPINAPIVAAMPLVVPGINSTSGNKTEEWQNKLVGKKLGDDASTETVCRFPFL